MQPEAALESKPDACSYHEVGVVVLASLHASLALLDVATSSLLSARTCSPKLLCELPEDVMRLRNRLKGCESSPIAGLLGSGLNALNGGRFSANGVGAGMQLSIWLATGGETKEQPELSGRWLSGCGESAIVNVSNGADPAEAPV